MPGLWVRGGVKEKRLLQKRPTGQSLIKIAQGDPLYAKIPLKESPPRTQADKQKQLKFMASASAILEAYNKFYKAEYECGRRAEWAIDPSDDVGCSEHTLILCLLRPYHIATPRSFILTSFLHGWW